MQYIDIVLDRVQQKDEFAMRCELIGISRQVIWARRARLMCSDVDGKLLHVLLILKIYVLGLLVTVTSSLGK